MQQLRVPAALVVQVKSDPCMLPPWEAARSHLTLAPFCDGYSQIYIASVHHLWTSYVYVA